MKVNLSYLQRHLPISTEYFEKIDSTSLYLKRCIKENKPPKELVIAGFQTNGQGRVGKTFYSPKSTGLYLTFCFAETEFTCSHITPRVALAASFAIESCFSIECGVKWVNDIYLDEKKIAGVLCQKVDGYVLIGIGVNVEKPKYIPQEIISRFGYICSECADDRYSELVVSLYREILRIAKMKHRDVLNEYRQRCIHLYRPVSVEYNGTLISGTCTGIADDFSLLVEAEGESREFSSGYMVLN